MAVEEASWGPLLLGLLAGPLGQPWEWSQGAQPGQAPQAAQAQVGEQARQDPSPQRY